MTCPRRQIRLLWGVDGTTRTVNLLARNRGCWLDRADAVVPRLKPLKPLARLGVHPGMRSSLLRLTLCLGLSAAVLAPQPLLADAETLKNAKAAHWTGTSLKGDSELRELAESGKPAAALSVLRAHERSAEPRLHALALALLYQHAARLGVDETTRGHLRSELMKVAEDRGAPASARAEACRVLLSGKWPGLDDWYMKLLTDPTLWELSEGTAIHTPLRWPLHRDPDYWVPRLLPLLAQPGATRSNVVQILAQLCDVDEAPPRRDVAVALLPWLADVGWAADVRYSPSPRAGYITSLSRIDLREAVPGLIHIVETEHGYIAARAAGSLIRYRDPRALPALQRGLAEHLATDWERGEYIGAIIACGGVTPQAGVAALETYARLAATPAGLEKLRELESATRSTIDAGLALGLILARASRADEALITALTERVQALRSPEPQVALALAAPLFAWEARGAQRYVVSQLASDTLSDSLLHRALVARPALVAGCGDELRAMLRRGGTAAGRAAAVLEVPAETELVLRSSDAAAILALLHAAMVSDRQGLDAGEDWDIIGNNSKDSAVLLPVDVVGPLLQSTNSAVATAARGFLSREAGKRAQAWLAAGGRVTKLATTTASHYSIGGAAPGMTREQVAAHNPTGGSITYSQSRVMSVSGASLRDGNRDVITAGSTAGDVRRLLGRPDRESAGHVHGLVGGFFWHYERNGQLIDFSFVDDDFSGGLRAPLYQVVLRAKSASRAP